MNELRSDSKAAAADFIHSPRSEEDTQSATDAWVNPGSERDAQIGQDAVRGEEIGSAQRVAGDLRSMQPNAFFATDELQRFRSQWDRVQASFVDEPRAAVENADSLVAHVVNRITEEFAVEREQLEEQWARGEDANTEALRQAFRRYRAFFDRLLSIRGYEAKGESATLS